MTRVWELPGDRYVVPGNRFDLLAGRWPAQPPTVSVVIPYYRRQRSLDLVLTGLAMQTHPPTRLEVLVADDGSPEPPCVAALGRDRGVIVLRQPDRGFRAAAARNLGARAASGELLCFLDGDTVPTPDYIRELTRLPALLPDAVVTGHRRHADLGGTTPEQVRRWFSGSADPPTEIPEPPWLASLHSGSAELLHLDRHSYRAVISAVLGCPARLFAEVGGFDETFTEYGGEDWELGYRLLNAGAVLAHEPRAVAWHDGADWGARQSGDPEAARTANDRETAALARLIPGIRPPRPVSRYPVGGYPVDVVVRIDAPAAVAAEAAAAYAADPRLDCAVTPSLRAPDTARCRTQIWVTGTDELPGAGVLRELVDRVGPGRLGRATVEVPGRWRAVAVSTAAAARAERWSGRLDADDLLAELFGAEESGGG